MPAPASRKSCGTLGAVKLAVRIALALACSAAWHPAAAFSDLSDPAIAALREYAQRVNADTPTSARHEILPEGALSALSDYAQQIGAGTTLARERAAESRGNSWRIAAETPPKAAKRGAPKAAARAPRTTR